MHSSKLIDVLKKLDAAKVNSLAQYINTVNTNKNNISFRLFNAIKKYHPEYAETKIDKKKIFSLLYPEKNYNEKRMLQVMSELLKTIEEFIVYSYTQKNILQKQYCLLQFYIDHNLLKYFETEFRRTLELVAETPEDTELLAFKFKLELLNIQYQVEFDNRYCNYQKLSDALNDFSLSQHYKLDNLCLINLYNNVEKNNGTSVLLELHHLLNDLLQKPDDAKYYSVKKQVLTDGFKIAKDELKTVVFIAVDYCIRKINKKQDEFLGELLGWYDFLIEENIVLESNNIISLALFKNYITISLRLNKKEKANEFLEKFKNHIDIRNRTDVYNYNKSNLLFHEGNFESSLVLLNKTRFKDIFYKISAKRLYIKIYYELTKANNKYEDVLESALNAFKKYVYTSQELTETIRARNKSFYKYMNKLIRLRFGEKQYFKSLMNDIKKDIECADREWILEKIEE